MNFAAIRSIKKYIIKLLALNHCFVCCFYMFFVGCFIYVPNHNKTSFILHFYYIFNNIWGFLHFKFILFLQIKIFINIYKTFSIYMNIKSIFSNILQWFVFLWFKKKTYAIIYDTFTHQQHKFWQHFVNIFNHNLLTNKFLKYSIKNKSFSLKFPKINL